MTIKYAENSMPVTEDGYYLLQVQFERHDSTRKLCVAERVGGEWYETGVDYDRWQYDQGTDYLLTVICGLDLEQIASAARKQA